VQAVRQHRRTARGLPCTPARVQALRFRNDIPGRRPSRDPQEGELLTVAETARELGLVPSTVHRWLNDGFIHGEQLTPGAPWRIRLTDEIRALLVDDTPGGWLATLEATHVYGVSRQTLLQRVKRGETRAVYLRTGRKKGLRIAPPAPQEGLF
jgi:transposase-like protein